jgi:predicted transcriptional regulator of viral defense system
MEFNSLLKITGSDPVFETSLLYAGKTDPVNVRLQLARWVTAGRVIRLRRGLYSVAPPYNPIRPHPFLVANRLQPASYVSLQTALAYYSMIPETVNRTVSVTTGRPEELETPLGTYVFRHVQPDLFFGYTSAIFGGREAFIARPEKALLDLIYLQPQGESRGYLDSLRLENLAIIDIAHLSQFAERFKSPKMNLAVKHIREMLLSSDGEYEDL